MAITVPPEIVTVLSGHPEVGSWEPMFPLLTVDELGFPHVCMLSRAELGADSQHVYAVLASPTTVRNLGRRPAATLIVIGDDSVRYLKLTAVRISAAALTGVVFEVVSSRRNRLELPLQPPRYLVTSALPVAEAWAQSAELLSRLAEDGVTPGTTGNVQRTDAPGQARGEDHADGRR